MTFPHTQTLYPISPVLSPQIYYCRVSHDTAEFAVESIRRWWQQIGKALYPEAMELFITADCGGSNGYRLRLWKVELQKLATELTLTMHVSHFPPGTSKWNKIGEDGRLSTGQQW